MRSFMRLTRVDGKAMILDVDNIECVEQANGMTLVHFKVHRNSVYFVEHIDYVWQMLNDSQEAQQ